MMIHSDDPIMAYLQTCRELTAFCSQNGWIIDESIEYGVLQREEDSILIYVTFLESIMEGAGCQCDQKPCYGRMSLTLNHNGKVIAAELA